MLSIAVGEGARRMLMTALRAEVDEYIGAHSGERDATDKALIVRNGVARPRKVTTAAGELDIQAPRVNDRRQGVCFRSAILLPWAQVSLPRDSSETLALLLSRGLLCAERDDHANGRPLVYGPLRGCCCLAWKR